MSLFKRKWLAYFIATSIAGIPSLSYSREYFNPSLLEVDNPEMKDADLSAFEEGTQAAGKYRVDILVNDDTVDTREVEFRNIKNANNETLQPCLSVSLLQSYGIKTILFPALGKDAECADLDAIPGASARFIFDVQKLVLSIPQAAMAPQARGTVPQELWDDGINAALLNYSLSGDETHSRDSNSHDSNSQYANLRPGINIGPWRLRNYTTWNRSSSGQSKWDTVYTYAQRNVVALKSQLTLGDSSTPSDIFDSISFSGAQMASDDDMLPDSMRGYAPVVRGIASTSAQVIIRQNGYVIYQSYVSPGAFEITDMYPTGGSGDLYVTVKDTDGSRHSFVVPFASVPVLQREGRLKYSITAGQYRSYDSEVETPALAQGTAIYGLPHGFTLYGGIQQSAHYQSLAIGIGKNMGAIGALSVDVSQAKSSPKGMDNAKGQSWRIRYSKNFTESGTNFALAGYRYSTAGYYGMQEVLDSWGDSSALSNRRRNRAELTLSQNLGSSAGSLSGSIIRENYWNSGKTMESWSLGYNNAWHGVAYGINYTVSHNSDDNGKSGGKIYDNDRQISVNMSIPLESLLSHTRANYSMNTSKQGNTRHSVGLSGTALQGNALSWGVQQGYGSDNVGNSGSINADHRGTYGEANGTYSYDKDSSRVSYGLNGGVMVHSEGITLGQPFGDTIALVSAPGIKGAAVSNQTGVKTDYRGYTVVSNVSPYRKNDISLDTDSLGDDVELALTSRTVVPTRGAVVRADYQANVGMRVLMTLLRDHNQPVPFGSTVTVVGKNSAHSFIVGDDGQVYLSGLGEHEILNVQWGNNNDKKCVTEFTLSRAQEVKQSHIYLSHEVCKKS